MLDLAGGVAVHARAGDRARYQPARSVLAPGAAGDPQALLRGFRQVLRAAECYVADLDAIRGGAVQEALLRRLADAEHGGPALMVDAATTRPDQARAVLSCGASWVVVGLESLLAFRDLGAIVREAGAERVAFSLDLRLGRPLLHPALEDLAGRATPDAAAIAARAVDLGVRTLVVLDIGRVGTGCGVDLDLLTSLRRRHPAERLVAGGGVRTRGDLERMRDAGCDAALVASALHSGGVGATDVAALAASRPRRTAGQSGTSDSR